jgi:hypothetical protein
LWNVQADRLDGAVHAMLRKSLPEQLALIKAHKFREDFDAQREHWHGMIKVAEKEIAGAKMRWENSEHPDLVRDAEASYKAAKTAKAAYEAKLAQIDALEAERDKIDVLKDRLDSLITQIEMTPEDQRLLFQLCLKEIQVYSEGNDLRIRAVYHDGSTLDRIFSRHPTDWTAPECKLLTTLVAQGATPLEIAAHFPFRTWQAIRAKNKSLSGVWLSIADCPIQMGETFEDYHNRTHPEPFTPEEIEEILCSIVTNSTLGTSDSYSGRILCLTCLS